MKQKEEEEAKQTQAMKRAWKRMNAVWARQIHYWNSLVSFFSLAESITHIRIYGEKDGRFEIANLVLA